MAKKRFLTAHKYAGETSRASFNSGQSDKHKNRVSQQTMDICHDCKMSILWKENYIVRPDVWEAAKMTPKGGCLHLKCLEARIERKLETADFLVVYGGESKTSTGMILTVLAPEAYLRFKEAMGY
jgi:NAD-dependent SIR2 family protein deacetylase